MKSVLALCFLFLPFFYSCNNSDQSETPTSENDVDAARNFIQAALEGHYNDARKLIVPDSANNVWLDILKRNYQQHMSPADKAGYRNASINIHNIQNINDSTTLIYYSNSYKKQNDSLRAVRQNGAWLIDLAYSFSHNATDSLP